MNIPRNGTRWAYWVALVALLGALATVAVAYTTARADRRETDTRIRERTAQLVFVCEQHNALVEAVRALARGGTPEVRARADLVLDDAQCDPDEFRIPTP